MLWLEVIQALLVGHLEDRIKARVGLALTINQPEPQLV